MKALFESFGAHRYATRSSKIREPFHQTYQRRALPAGTESIFPLGATDLHERPILPST